MLSATNFRRIVLGMRDAIEGVHMGHADFRVNGRIFASLNGDETRGMVVLTPDQQQRFLEEHPSAFEPESGAWGRSGCTRVHLERVEEEMLGEAATLAWRNSMSRGPVRARKAAPYKRAASAPRARRSRGTPSK